ncbi:hypothetical protein Ddye_011384 [Dipteronia dyeriana]|uniref:Uncharacterized protein n=1 Tax=Dipteronia dyeriana TaxID=168575 RepID=A0AAD9X2G5_9ROSI|nr:hypothetical protein Ddye_011384 [Dipteronia dyeriana]
MNDDTDVEDLNPKCLYGYQLDVSHIGHIPIREDIFGGVAIIIGDMRIVDFSDSLIHRCVQSQK